MSDVLAETAAGSADGQSTAVANRRTAAQVALLCAGMMGLGFAAVPFYDWFCRVTGFGGTTQVAATVSDTVLDQTIKVRFDASTGRDMPWVFEPVQNEIELRIGETGVAFYRATNPTDRPVTGVASFNVAPLTTGGYFMKIACFCFNEQTLQPGQSVDMPVTFYVDPEIVEDPDVADTRVITLSYTFFETEEPIAAVVERPGAARPD